MLVALVGLNLVAGFSMFALPERNRGAARFLALAAASVSLVLSVLVFALYDRSVGGFQFENQFTWLPSLGISFHVGVDGISAPMVLLTGVVIFHRRARLVEHRSPHP